MMGKKRQYLIPFTYDHAPEEFEFVRVHSTDMKEIRKLARCIFGGDPNDMVTIAYQDVDMKE